MSTTSDDNCTNHFTPNQVARMHCYLDMVYQGWLLDRDPASIPLPPIVTDQSPDSVSIYWLSPLRGRLYQRYDLIVSSWKDNLFKYRSDQFQMFFFSQLSQLFRSHVWSQLWRL